MKSPANKFLDRRALLKAAALVGDVSSELEASRPKPPPPRPIDLNGGISALPIRREWEKYEVQLTEWRSDVRVSINLLNRHRDVKFLTMSKEYGGLREALKLQAGRRAQVFSDPLAQLWLLEAVLLALVERALFKIQRRVPITARVQDYRRVENVLRALETVARLQIVCGEQVAALKADFESRRVFAKKPHVDRHALDRHVCHMFAKYLFVHFKGTVPPALVKRFGSLIKYDAESLVAEPLTKWVAALRAGHLDIPTPGVF